MKFLEGQNIGKYKLTLSDLPKIQNNSLTDQKYSRRHKNRTQFISLGPAQLKIKSPFSIEPNKNISNKHTHCSQSGACKACLIKSKMLGLSYDKFQYLRKSQVHHYLTIRPEQFISQAEEQEIYKPNFCQPKFQKDLKDRRIEKEENLINFIRIIKSTDNSIKEYFFKKTQRNCQNSDVIKIIYQFYRENEGININNGNWLKNPKLHQKVRQLSEPPKQNVKLLHNLPSKMKKNRQKQSSHQQQLTDEQKNILTVFVNKNKESLKGMKYENIKQTLLDYIKKERALKNKLNDKKLRLMVNFIQKSKEKVKFEQIEKPKTKITKRLKKTKNRNQFGMNDGEQEIDEWKSSKEYLLSLDQIHSDIDSADNEDDEQYLRNNSNKKMKKSQKSMNKFSSGYLDQQQQQQAEGTEEGNGTNKSIMKSIQNDFISEKSQTIGQVSQSKQVSRKNSRSSSVTSNKSSKQSKNKIYLETKNSNTDIFDTIAQDNSINQIDASNKPQNIFKFNEKQTKIPQFRKFNKKLSYFSHLNTMEKQRNHKKIISLKDKALNYLQNHIQEIQKGQGILLQLGLDNYIINNVDSLFIKKKKIRIINQLIRKDYNTLEDQILKQLFNYLSIYDESCRILMMKDKIKTQTQDLENNSCLASQLGKKMYMKNLIFYDLAKDYEFGEADESQLVFNKNIIQLANETSYKNKMIQIVQQKPKMIPQFGGYKGNLMQKQLSKFGKVQNCLRA